MGYTECVRLRWPAPPRRRTLLPNQAPSGRTNSAPTPHRRPRRAPVDTVRAIKPATRAFGGVWSGFGIGKYIYSYSCMRPLNGLEWKCMGFGRGLE